MNLPTRVSSSFKFFFSSNLLNYSFPLKMNFSWKVWLKMFWHCREMWPFVGISVYLSLLHQINGTYYCSKINVGFELFKFPWISGFNNNFSAILTCGSNPTIFTFPDFPVFSFWKGYFSSVQSWRSCRAALLAGHKTSSLQSTGGQAVGWSCTSSQCGRRNHCHKQETPFIFRMVSSIRLVVVFVLFLCFFFFFFLACRPDFRTLCTLEKVQAAVRYNRERHFRFIGSLRRGS